MLPYRWFYNVAIPKTCKLRFEVWDEDVGKDDSLGRVDIEFDPSNGIKTSGVKDPQGFMFIEHELKDKHGKVVEREKDGVVLVSKLQLRIRLHPSMAGMGHQQMMNQPMVGHPMVGQPMVGLPMVGQPMVGQPMVGQPMVGHPSTGYPAMGHHL